jgi:CDP-glucose 4,6-dehydratase
LEGAYNFGPLTQDAASVRDVIEMARRAYGNGLVRYVEEKQGPHEAGLLALDITKARQTLGFQPGLTLANSIQRTIIWYQSQFSGLDPLALCDNEITEYEASR